MEPWLLHVVAGAVGGIIGELGRNKGVLDLPSFTRDAEKGLGLNVGFLSGIAIGAFVGFMVDHNPTLSGAAGYIGIKFVDYLVHQLFPEFIEARKAKLSLKQSQEIMARINAGENPISLAEEYNVSLDIVCLLCSKRGGEDDADTGYKS